MAPVWFCMPQGMENMMVCSTLCYQLSKLVEVYYMRWKTTLHNQCHCQADIAENMSYVRQEDDGLNSCDISCSIVDVSERNNCVVHAIYFFRLDSSLAFDLTSLKKCVRSVAILASIELSSQKEKDRHVRDTHQHIMKYHTTSYNQAHSLEPKCNNRSVTLLQAGFQLSCLGCIL